MGWMLYGIIGAGVMAGSEIWFQSESGRSQKVRSFMAGIFWPGAFAALLVMILMDKGRVGR